MKYTVILEQDDSSFGAYVPDLPGCIAAAETKEEALELIAEAIEVQLEDLRVRGEKIPGKCQGSCGIVLPNTRTNSDRRIR